MKGGVKGYMTPWCPGSFFISIINSFGVAGNILGEGRESGGQRNMI